jgi:SH3-like domain-containing protein
VKLTTAVRALVLVCLAGLLLACGRGSLRTKEVAYVSAQQATLRDRLAPVYNKVATVNNGERVEILETKKRFAHVRTASGAEGWVELRNLVNAEVFEGFGKLAKENGATPAQAAGLTRAPLNMHLTPDRDSEHLYQLKDGEKVDIVKRATAEKPRPKLVTQEGQKDLPKVFEDWWLVRDARHHAGWVLARMVDIDAPLEVAQYAEGQRIMGCFVLNQVRDDDKQVSQYLVLLTEPKDGQAFDYSQARIFTWNVKRHRYETAYRERGLAGFFPTRVSHEAFPNEGDLPTFILHTQDENGQFADRKYKLNGPIVRRVLSPEEQAKVDAQKASRPNPKPRGKSAGR